MFIIKLFLFKINFFIQYLNRFQTRLFFIETLIIQIMANQSENTRFNQYLIFSKLGLILFFFQHIYLQYQYLFVIKKMDASFSELRQILVTIFSQNKDTKDITQEEEMMKILLDCLSAPQNINKFTNYLQEECHLKANLILNILEKLRANPDSKKMLGQNLLKQLLLYNIFQTMDIIKKNDTGKRKAVTQVFRLFQFHNGEDNSIEVLVTNCWTKVDKHIGEMNEILQAITSKEQTEINNLFKKNQIQIVQYNPDKSIDQSIKDLISDMQRMSGGSFEMLLQKWLIYSFLLKNCQKKEIQGLNLKLPKLPTSFSQIDNLKHAYLQYSKDFKLNSNQILEIFNEVSPDNLYQSISSIKSKICPINVPELTRLINKTKSSQELIRGKEIILFVGTTGSGKSTIILKCFGYNLKFGNYKELTTLIPCEELQKQHKTFHTSPEAKSCTRYINAASIPAKMFPQNSKSSDRQLMVCDSPGFGDSAGVEVDIANGVGTINALRQAKSVRIVVVLPYESIIAERMAGVHKISQIIVSLFSDIDQVLGSISILFNKTPENQIAKLHIKINNAVQIWKQQHKDEKFYKFFLKIHKQSKKKENFINPLNNDFKVVLRQIIQTPRFTEMQLFLYDFTDETKQRIQSFIFTSIEHIKKYCQAKNYQNSSYYFENLQQIKSILNKSNKLVESYKQIQKYLIKQSRKMFDEYNQEVDYFINRGPSKGKKQNMKAIGEQLTNFYQIFSKFQSLKPSLVSPQKMKELIAQKQNDILGQYNQDSIQKINSQSILTAKSFSQEFNKGFFTKVSEKLKEIFQKNQKYIMGSLREKRYKEIAQALSKLKHLSNIIIKLNKQKKIEQQAVLNPNQSIKSIHDQLFNNIKEAQRQLTGISTASSIKMSDINKANQKIKEFNQILQLNFFDKSITSESQKKLNDLLRSIEIQCRRRIRSVENINTLERSQSNKNQLSQSLKHIELLMQVGDLKIQLMQEYKQAKIFLQAKLQQNKQQIIKFIAALKGNNIEQLEKSLYNIIAAGTSVKNCSQLLGIKNAQFDSIQQEFVNFVKRQAQKIDKIDYKLNNMPQKFVKIQEMYIKIQKYKNTERFGVKIVEAINEMREKFFKMLKKPVEQFYLKYLKDFDTKKFKNLVNILQKFQTYCQYIIKIEQLLTNEQYKQYIKPDQQQNLNTLRLIYDNISRQTQNFQKFDFPNDGIPSYLKQSLRVLLSHSENQSLNKYLEKKLDFQVKGSLKSIQRNLENIKNQLQTYSQNYKVSDCRFYYQIEEIYRIKTKQRQKFGFRQIFQKLQQQYNKKIQNEEQRLTQMIKDCKADQIPFKQIKFIYDRCIEEPGVENQRKRKIITSQLEQIEKKISQNLKKYSQELLEGSGIFKSSNMDNFLEYFQQAIFIEKQLKQLYTQENDKKKIIIKLSTFEKIKDKLFANYIQEAKKIMTSLQDYNINSFNQQFKSFSYQENIIPNLFQNGTQAIKNENDILLFIKNKGDEIKNKIKSISTLTTQQEDQLKKKTNLKDLFQQLRNKIQKKIKNHYQNNLAEIIIDTNLSKYYQQAQSEQKHQIQKKIQQKFNILLNNYQQKWSNSSEQAEQITKNIQQCIKYLPHKLKDLYAEKFEKLKQIINQQETQEIKKLCKNIFEHRTPINQLFKRANYFKQSNKNNSYLKLLRQFKLIFKQPTLKINEVQYIIKFIQINLFQALSFEPEYSELNEFFSFLRQKTDESLTALMTITNKYFKILQESFAKEVKGQSQVIGKQSMRQIIIICKFIDKDNNRNNLKGTKLIEILFSSLSKIIQIFQIEVDKIASQITNYSLICKNFHINLKRLKQLKAKEYVISQLIKYLEKNTQLKQKMSKIPLIDIFIQTQMKQIIKMLFFLEHYDFFGDNKRNMIDSQLQEDLCKLNTYYQTLQKNKCLLLQMNGQDYNLSQIAAKINTKFQKHFTQTKKEIKNNFKTISGTVSDRPTILIRQLEILKKIQYKSFKCILSQVDLKLKQIPQIIESQFQQLFAKCEQSLKKIVLLNRQKWDKIKQASKEMEANLYQKTQKNKQKLQKQIKNIQKIYINQFQNDAQMKKQNEKKFQSQKQSIQKDLKDEIQTQRQRLELEYQKTLNNCQQKNLQQAKEFTFQLIVFKKNLIDYPNFSKFQKQFNQILMPLYSQKKQSRLIELIQKSLVTNHPDDQRAIAKLILMKEKAFSGYATKRINNLIRGQNIDYVINNLYKIGEENKSSFQKQQMGRIKELFQVFNELYQTFKDKYSKNPSSITINNLVQKLKDLGASIKGQFYQHQRPVKQFKAKMMLLSGIFALWAILRSQKDQSGNVEYTIEPHPTQITALILLLGISSPSQNISNSFAQIGTGEGKSIVLAGLSCYLALTGFTVRCACYSSYLSSRDSQNFKELFMKLGVEDNIKYGTFNQTCEDILNKNGKNFAQQIKKMILQPPSGFIQSITNFFGGNQFSFKRNIKQNSKILIVDEVDVFFEDSFFGNTYCPAISLQGKNVQNLLRLVWQQVKIFGAIANPQKIRQSQQFQQLIKQYPSLQKILTNHIHGMIFGALNYKHSYQIINNKIVYKDGDLLSSKLSYGYKTSFAYLYQFQNKRVQASSVDESLKISLVIAEFSYALLPKYFNNILGVTGTLEMLPKMKKILLSQQYSIKNQYQIPSPFGLNEKRIINYFITAQNGFFKLIIDRIEQVQNNRPILIFFRSIGQLDQFATSKEFSKYTYRSSNVSQKHDNDIRNSRIARAVNAGNITLLSSAFCRGTDFMIFDDKINQHGGLHVIQAFLSLQQAQEIQTQGRTARQNSHGSYDCIINQNWLEQLDLKKSQLPLDPKQIKKKLKNARQKRYNKQAQNTKKMFQEANKKHRKVMEVFNRTTLKQKQLIDYIEQVNRYPTIVNRIIKTVLALDATGSMTYALRKTCQIIGNTFERTFEVLKKNKVQALIEIKINIYRNYNSPFDQIIQGTPFQNLAHNLKNFLSKVKPKGGWGNQALQVLFQSLNKQSKIDQVILIGDAPPNTAQEVQTKRSATKGQIDGEYYWRNYGFPLTNIQKQLQIFGENHKGCPVHSFYLNNGSGFMDISKKTNGQAKRFQINSDKVTENLEAFIVENILRIIEKSKGSNQKLGLVQEYRKMYLQGK